MIKTIPLKINKKRSSVALLNTIDNVIRQTVIMEACIQLSGTGDPDNDYLEMAERMARAISKSARNIKHVLHDITEYPTTEGRRDDVE